MYKIILLRHGESVWNKENRFTGWTDVGLSEKGVEEASVAGKLFKQDNYSFDIAFTSVLKRAINTLEICLKEMGLEDIPVIRSWKLNERHYGALQGLNKSETAKKFGEEKVLIWRRSYNVPPPALTADDERYPGNDSVYSDIEPEQLPLTECLRDTVERVVPFWENEIVKEIKAGKKVIIVAHGNSLRALVKHLDGMSDEDILNVNIPTGIPLLYELDENMKPIKSHYLGDLEKVKQAMNSVASQGKSA